jgi:type II secretory pathway component GspD/PulD (secretin)
LSSGRRKEVALRSLKSLTILLTLGAWGAATDGAPPDDAAPPGAPSARPEPPAPPRDYIKAGAWLLQAGDHARAAQYLKAAEDYRDLLTAEEQASLDGMKQRLNGAGAGASAQPTTAPDPAPTQEAADSSRATAAALVGQARQALGLGRTDEARRLARQAESLGATFGPGEDSPAHVLQEIDGPPAAVASPVRNASGDDKQAARWILHQAKELAAQGHHDEALRKVAEARAMRIHWTLFDETPDRVAAAIEKSRPHAAAAPGATRGDRRQAKARLKEARAAIASGRVDQAEAIAQEVGSWNLRFSILDDNPDKVLAAVEAIKRRDAVRQNGTAAGLGQDLYNVLVQEARAAMAAGQIEVAEAKAQQAQRMNVVLPVTADRAESVLHEIAMLRARNGAVVAAPDGEPPSAAAERDANAMLAAGQQEQAAAKFVEAERLRAQEMAPAVVATTGDPAVQQVQAQAPLVAEPTPALALQPVAAEPAPAPQPVALEPAPVAQPVALEPAPAPQPAPTLELATPDAAPAGNEGDALLQQASVLMSSGNFEQAQQLAQQAKAGGYGVDAKADDLLAQIALARQGGALKLYEAALDAMRKGDADRAKALLNEVAALENQDEALMQKVQDLLARMPGDQPGTATLGAVNDAEAVKAQRLNVEVGTKVAESRRLLETDPEKAIELLQQTLTAIKQAEVNPTAARTMTRRVEVAIELARKDKAAFDEKMKDKAYRAEIEAKRLRILEADKAKQAQVADLMAKAKDAETRGEWAEAEQYAKRAAEIDPNNIAATALSAVMRIKRHYERDKDIKARMEDGAVEAFQAVSEAGIADPTVQQRGIAYAKDFSDLTRRRRDLDLRLAPPKAPEVQAIEDKLNEPVTLDMEQEQPLSQVMSYLSSYTGLNIIVDPKALAEEGLTENTPVKVTAKGIKLKTALKFLLSPLNLTYRIDEGGVLAITNPQASRSQTNPKAYPVADLIISPHAKRKSQDTPAGMGGINSTNPGMLGDPNVNQAALNSPDAGAVITGQPGASGNAQPTFGSGDRQLSMDDFEPLINLIKASVAPGTWKDGTEAVSGGAYGLGGGGLGGDALGGGTEAVGSITPFFLNISLIIRHTNEVHDEIVDLLRQLRRLQDLQISVEVRFITVSDSFFEAIGVDFDFNIQSDVVGRKSSFAIPNPAAVPGAATAATGGATAGQTAAIAPYLINPSRDHSLGNRQPLVVGLGGPTENTQNPNFTGNLGIPFTQSSAGAIQPFNALTSNVGAQFGLAFLSDLEVYLFLTAVQGDTRNNLVQCPKVTTFNGAPAFVINAVNRNYVAALLPVVGAGAVAFQPTIGSFPDGVQLFVTPVVSADRRYVRMTLSPIFQTLIQFDTFTIPAAVGGGGLGGGATNINGQVQLPQFSITQISTTVTVPDGGTVLLGGVKRLREQRQEFGVPVLAKTPLINRLFRNIGVGRTTDSLMLMVTPRIIILEEEEERLGIPAVQNVTF